MDEPLDCLDMEKKYKTYAELQQENQRLKEVHEGTLRSADDLIVKLRETIADYKELLAEKDAENQRLMERTVDLRLDLGKANAENQRLRGLLQDIFYGIEWTLDDRHVELMERVEKEVSNEAD